MEFKIESKIPVSEDALHLGPNPTRVFYPYDKMKVGNSFSVKQKDEKTLDQIKKSLYYSVRNFQKKNPNNAHMEFKIAIIIPNNEVRVWRTT